MQTVLNLSGVRVHVLLERIGRHGICWVVEDACVVDQEGTYVYSIDDIDALGITRNGVFHSVRTLAEECIDGQRAAIELADRRSVVENRVDLRDWSEPEI